MEATTVLIADDNEAIREALHVLLELRDDLQVVGEAADGLEALQKAEALRPDIVIMDIRMPNMSGVEAAKRLRDTCPETKVIAFTAEDHEAYARDMLNAGACAVLLKPCSLEDLVRAVGQALGHEGAEQDS